MVMPIFQVAVTRKPTRAESEAGKSEVLLIEPTTVMANDQLSAVLALASKVSLPKSVDYGQAVVAVKLF